MKHLFAVVREERTSLIGDVKSEKVQRGCVYDPTTGAVIGKRNDNKIGKDFNFDCLNWTESLFAVINAELDDVTAPCKIFCNKSVSKIGYTMEQAVPAVILLKEDESNELYEVLLNNAIDHGVTKDVIANAIKSKSLDLLSKILVCAVSGLEDLHTDTFSNQQLLTIATYVLKGNRFDQYGIYYVNDKYDKVGTEYLQYWKNINHIKADMIEGIQTNNTKDEYKNVPDLFIVDAD